MHKDIHPIIGWLGLALIAALLAISLFGCGSADDTPPPAPLHYHNVTAHPLTQHISEPSAEPSAEASRGN